MQSSTTTLKLPELNHSDPKHNYTNLMTYRKDGIRIQHEEIQGKHIFHNYGHGAAGVSLAFGSAYITGKSLTIFADINQPIQCAVIGAGIIGLSCANQLSKLGYKVTVYAQKIPNLAKQSTVPSQFGYCCWSPDCYEWTQDILKHEMLSKLSYDYYKDCIKLRRYSSVRYSQTYERNRYLQEMQEVVSNFICNSFKSTYLSIGGKIQQAVHYESICIDSSLYVQELKTQCVLRGVNFVEKQFCSLEEILKVPQMYIINSTGGSSRYLFNDQNVYGMVGQVLSLQVNNISKQPYFVRQVSQNRNVMTYFHHGKKLMLIGKYQHVPDAWSTPQYQFQQTVKVQDTLSQLHAFINMRKIKPKL